ALWFANAGRLGHWAGDVGLGELPPRDLSDIFRLGALLALGLAVFALFLPHTPPQRHVRGGAAPLAAPRLLRGQDFAVYAACNLGVCGTMSFTSQCPPLLLAHLGVPDEWLAPTLTVAQVTEVLSLGLLPMFLLRLGLRGTMVLGLGAWAAALSI